MALNKPIGETIKALRKQMYYTQIDLAKYLKVDVGVISKIEKNEYVITSDMLDKISSLFGISTDSFYETVLPIGLKANKDNLEMISDINRIVLNLNFMN